MNKALKFLRENIIWLAILVCFIIAFIVCGVWSVNNPHIYFETGDGPMVEAITVRRGDSISPPRADEITYEGHTLEGWYTDSEFTSRFDGGEVNGSMTLYANWNTAVHTVTFNTFVGEMHGEASLQIEHGSVLDYAPDVTHKTYSFEGWYLDTAFTMPYTPGETLITENTNIWAKFGTPTALADNLSAPVIYIKTERSIDKERYTKCTVIIEQNDMEYSYKTITAQIRGRGNSTWNFDKKPYRLKFDNKVDLFGMGKARDWILLANSVDKTMLRNFTVYRMAQQFEGLKNTTDCEFAHIYINDDYRGLYLITEQVEEGKNRVEIGDGLDKDGKICAPEEMGFLLECGRGGDSNNGQRKFTPKSFKSVSTDHVIIKSPDPENLKDIHVEYIKKYYEDVQEAIANDDFDKLCELVDIQSFVDSFICTMYVLSGDMGYDYFMYKEPGGKLFMGPLWDYDQSSAASEHGGNRFTGWNAADPHPWYMKLIKNENFRQLVIDSWIEHYDYIHNIPDMLYDVADKYEADIDLNYKRWKGFLTSREWRTPIEITRLKTYPEHVDHLVKWLNNRVDWIERELEIEAKEAK